MKPVPKPEPERRLRLRLQFQKKLGTGTVGAVSVPTLEPELVGIGTSYMDKVSFGRQL